MRKWRKVVARVLKTKLKSSWRLPLLMDNIVLYIVLLVTFYILILFMPPLSFYLFIHLSLSFPYLGKCNILILVILVYDVSLDAFGEDIISIWTIALCLMSWKYCLALCLMSWKYCLYRLWCATLNKRVIFHVDFM
jgi:uncharacterized membrane protein